MLLKKKIFLPSVLFSSVFLLTGCPLDKDDDEEHVESACIDNAQEVVTSDDRSLCVSLTAFKAEAPFTAGLKGPGKTTHTVFISDSEGNPVDVTTDDVVSGVSQYPMMFMNNGHMHSAPYKAADTSAAEYGAYNFDVYYPMGRWEYRVLVTDNMGTDDVADDKTHTVTFEPTVEMNMSTVAFRAVGQNESDMYKNSMDLETKRQYSAWIDSVGAVVNSEADVKIYLTTQDLEHEAVPAMAAMTKVSAREEEHVHNHESATAMGDMDSVDAQTYPAVHAPMDMMGTLTTLTLNTEVAGDTVDVATVTVEVSTDDGTVWTTLMAGMTHADLGYYSGTVPMTAGEVTMLVKVTVNGNEMYLNGVVDDGSPALKFMAAE